MSSNCPYCSDSDTYYEIFLPEENGTGYNKCCGCNKWSYFVPNEGQKELPISVTDELLESKLNNI